MDDPNMGDFYIIIREFKGAYRNVTALFMDDIVSEQNHIISYNLSLYET